MPTGIYTRTEKHRQILSLAKKGIRLSEETKKKIGEAIGGENHPMFGKKHSEKSRQKMKISHLGKYAGKNNPNWGKKYSTEHRKKLSLAHIGQKGFWKGKEMSNEHRENLRIAHLGKTPWNKGKKLPQMAGEKCHLWKGGITPINAKIRGSVEYKNWRDSIFERDNYTCIWCGVRGGKLNADHIKPFAYYPELRLTTNNGRTLCVDCHKKTDTYGGKIRSKSQILWQLIIELETRVSILEKK